MHIPDGIIPAAVTISGYAVTAGITAFVLQKIKKQHDPYSLIPRASLLTAAFIVGSWIQIPVPPTTVHLMLVGMMGLMLGYYAFPAILIGLIFQAIMFQHGGITTIGVNALCFGIPALCSHWLFRPLLNKAVQKQSRKGLGFAGFMAGITGAALSVLFFYFFLIHFFPVDLNIVTEKRAITLLTFAHIPIMFLEGFMSAGLILYFHKVKPEMLKGVGS